MLGELEKNQAEHGGAVFAGLEVGVGAELVGSLLIGRVPVS